MEPVVPSPQAGTSPLPSPWELHLLWQELHLSSQPSAPVAVTPLVVASSPFLSFPSSLCEKLHGLHLLACPSVASSFYAFGHPLVRPEQFQEGLRETFLHPRSSGRSLSTTGAGTGTSSAGSVGDTDRATSLTDGRPCWSGL